MTLSPERISNGNELISKREWRYLDKLSRNPSYLERYGKEELKKIKDLLKKQMDAYIERKRPTPKRASINNVKDMTNTIIKKIDSILGTKNDTEISEKSKYPSIQYPDKLKKLFSVKDITESDIKRWERKRWRSIKVHYEDRSESIRVKDLRNFYDNEMVKKEEVKPVKEETKPVKQGDSKEWKEGVEPSELKEIREEKQGDNMKWKEGVDSSELKEIGEINPKKKELEKIDTLKQKLEDLFKIKEVGFLKFMKELFTSDEDLKMGNISRVYELLKKGRKNLKIFQEYAKQQGWYKGKIDGKWGPNSKKAFDEYLKQEKNTSIHKINEWRLIQHKKQYELIHTLGQEAIQYEEQLFGEGGLYEGLTEKQVVEEYNSIENIEHNYENLILNQKVQGMPKKYKSLYIKLTKRTFDYELPKNSREVIEQFSKITLEDVLKDEYIKNLETKYLIKKHWSEIKQALDGGLLRALKNTNHYFKGRLDITKLPIVINIPIGKKHKGKYENASLSFIYDPKFNKINIEVFSYGFRFKNVWSNTPNSNATPLGTSIILLNTLNKRDSFSQHIRHSQWGFRLSKKGIEYGINNNNESRGILIHGVSPTRSKYIKKGLSSSKTIGSWGCTIYPDMDYANIMKKNQRKRYAIEEITYPIL